jgi:MFS family permease
MVAIAFSLARVSYLFYLVRAAEALGGIKAAIGWYLWFNILYAAAAYPAGRLGDRVGRPKLLVAGYLTTAACAGMFALDPSLPTMFAGFTLLGLSFALAEGQGSALAADLAGSQVRSTRLGQYHAFTGVATVVGGLVAGVLWDSVSHAAAFLWGAALPIVATIGLLAIRPPPMPGYAEPPGHDH